MILQYITYHNSTSDAPQVIELIITINRATGSVFYIIIRHHIDLILYYLKPPFSLQLSLSFFVSTFPIQTQQCQHFKNSQHRLFAQALKIKLVRGYITSSHTEVVSLPVNRYWPIKIVSPFFTACKIMDTIVKKTNIIHTNTIKYNIRNKKAKFANPKSQTREKREVL